MADPFTALYGEDPQAAQAAAQELAQAMARRKAAGVVSTIAGGPFAGFGKASMDDASNSADLLARALQFRGNQQLQRERMDRYGPNEPAERFIAVPAGGYAVSTKDARTVPIPKVDRPALSRTPAPKEQKPPDTSKRYLGAYLTPAEQDIPDAQRNDLMNNLAGPGAEWIDQMAELSALLDVAGDAPTPDQISDIHRLIAAGLTKQNKVAGLGALSGPDLDLLKKAGGSVGDLTNFLGQATGLRDLKRSVRSAAERGARDIQIRAGGYGAKPIPGQALDFGTFDARASEYRKKWGGAPAKSSPAAAGPKRPRRTVGTETREWDGSNWVPVKGE